MAIAIYQQFKGTVIQMKISDYARAILYYAIKLILKVPSVTFLYVVLRFKPLRQMSINMITINS